MKYLYSFSLFLLINLQLYSQCANTSSFGTATAPATAGSSVTISTCSYQSEYSTVSGFTAGNTYSINNSSGGCATIHSGSASGPVVVFGNVPLSFAPTTSGTYYISWNTNCSSCNTASNCGTTTVTAVTVAGGGGGGGGCANANSFGGTAAPVSNNPITISSCNYQTEYNTITSVTAGSTYTSNSSCGGYITVHSGTPTGPVVGQGNAPLSWTATVSGTYYISYNTNSACGTATNCCTTTITCSSCLPPQPCIALNGNSSCATADPFCTSNIYNYCNTTNVASIGGGGIYGCLGSSPNPSFFYLNIATSGTINMTLSQTTTAGAGIDVDYIIWGPFGSQGAMCSGVASTNIVSCSFSFAAIEYPTITSAVAGQWYMMMITNYSNTAGSINVQQTGGAGATNCAILCNMTGLTATPSACSSPANTYSVTGTITSTNPPTTGTLTITSSCGGSQTINPPFATSQNYSITGITANGGACSITATYSADPTCTLTQAYTAPAACNTTCSLTAGNNGPVCQGNAFNLTATAVAGATGYSWSGPSAFSSTAQNPTGVGAALAAGTYTYTVVATTAGGTCSSTTTVTVNARPTVTIPALTICNGSSGTLTASGAATYAWANATGLSATTGTSVTANPTTTTTYTVTGTAANGCTNTGTVTVTVNPRPTVTATPITICNGASGTLTASGASTYTWAPSTGLSGTTGTSVTASPTTTTTYTVTGTSAAGCTNTGTVTVTVNPIPSSTFTQSPNQCLT